MMKKMFIAKQGTQETQRFSNPRTSRHQAASANTRRTDDLFAGNIIILYTGNNGFERTYKYLHYIKWC